MALITRQTDEKLQSLRSAAMSGQLGGAVSVFVLQAVDGVYAAPGNFKTSQAILDHLQTLTYLVDLHVYRKR